MAAREQVRKNQSPEATLAELQATLTRCFAIAAPDAMCRTLAAQADLVAADWQAQLNKPTLPTLTLALQKATEATKSPETYPDAWRVLAETHLKLAQAKGTKPRARDDHLDAGMAAVAKIFTINSKHALGRATQGSLALLSAQSQKDTAARHTSAQAAVTALEQAVKSDPFLTVSLTPLLAQARTLATAP